MNKYILFFIFIFCRFDAFGQIILEGQILSSAGVPLTNVSVSVSRVNNSKVLSFAISDVKGYYKIVIDSKDDSLLLRASLLGYESGQKIVLNRNATNTFILHPAVVTLKEVTVANSAIRQGKDTISYRVQAFASKDDRSISDVLKKLPGLEVLDNGAILYQGKPIQALLVNGLDLLEGRYSLASNNLPHDAVKDVQVIENDQRIKVLDSLVASDRTTLNLRLKRFLTTGTGTIGVGIDPFLWDISITPITYNKSFQALNSYQTNNTGRDKTSQLRVQTVDALFEGSTKQNISILVGQDLSNPPFDQQFWLRNNLHLISSNILKVLKRDVQIKFNLSFSTDFQSKYGSTNSAITIPGQIVQISEVKQNTLNNNSLRASSVLEKNTNKVYFKNTFSYDKGWSNLENGLSKGVKAISETLSNEAISVSNKLSVIKPIGKQLVNINSSLSYNRLPQTLNVRPGQFDSIFNDNKVYEETTQFLKSGSFQTNNYLSIVKGANKFTIIPKVGVETNNQFLKTNITTRSSGTILELGNIFKNDISLLKSNVYQELGCQYKSGDFLSGLIIRLSEQSYLFRDKLTNSSTSTDKFLIEPKFNVRAKLNQNVEATFFSSLNNEFGEISQLFGAYILRSYRNLQRLNSTLPANMNTLNGISLNYKEPLKGLFFSAGYSITNTKKNLLYKNTFNSDGSSTLEYIVKDNIQQSQSFNTTVSKYFGTIKTIITLKARLNTSFSEQLINNDFSKIAVKTSGFNITLANSYFKHLGVDYDGAISISKSNLKEKEFSDIRLQVHNLKVNIFAATNQMLSINTRLYYSSLSAQTGQAFVNLLYRLTLSKRKVDLEMNCVNVLNTGYYTTAYSDGVLTVENIFQMRPRQVLLSIRFSF